MSIPILMYHQIDVPPARGTALRGLVVAPQSFARQMALLKLLGYRGLSMRDLQPYLQGDTATCYGVSAMIGATNSWDLDKGIPQKPLMTRDDWRAWSAAGMDVGSHTRNHANLPSLSTEQAQEQITLSKQELETLCGCGVKHFCYPYGWFTDEHKMLVQQAGYHTATTTARGRVHVGDDPFALKRIMVARATHLALFAAKIVTRYEDRRA